jgi:hypothetical protein
MKRGVHREEPRGPVSKVRPFTLRLPEELYVIVVEMAQASDKTQNAICTELIEIGLGKKIDVRDALQDLLNREFPPHALTAAS